MTLPELTTQAHQGRLTWDQAKTAVELMFTGEESQDTIISFLKAVNTRPIQADELAGYVQAIEHSATMLLFTEEFDLPMLDIAGTGGDGLATINVSTLASIICAATDQLIVTKYGNRAATSKSGSMDVLEELGIPIELTRDQVMQSLQSKHYAPLFARTIYPGAKHVAQARSQLKPDPSLFNLAFPIARPITGNLNILMGIANPDYLNLFSQIYAIAPGVNRVLLVHGKDGSDEVSITGSGLTDYYLIQDNQVHTGTLDISQVGINPVDVSLLTITDTADSAAWFTKLLDPKYQPTPAEQYKHDAMQNFAVLNAAAGLFIALDTTHDLQSALPKYINLARKTILEGHAITKLKSLQSQ